MKANSDTTPQLHIGLDVHKEKTSVAVADPGSKGEVRLHSEVATTQVALDRMIRRIAKARKIPLSRISVCYEAGGCGMWIARMFLKMNDRTITYHVALPARVLRAQNRPHMKDRPQKVDHKNPSLRRVVRTH